MNDTELIKCREAFAIRVRKSHGWSIDATVDDCCDLESMHYNTWVVAWNAAIAQPVQVTMQDAIDYWQKRTELDAIDYWQKRTELDAKLHDTINQESLRVACLSLEGVTVTCLVSELQDVISIDDTNNTYALTFKSMSTEQYQALKDFNGF